MTKWDVINVLCFGPMWGLLLYCTVAVAVTSTPWWKRRQELLQARHEKLMRELSDASTREE